MNLGLSGRLTKATLNSPLTPLMLLAAIAVGLMAVLSIPREEEPQISVPMVDIMVSAPGLGASDATELAAKPLEAIVRSIDGVEHVYTQVQDDQVIVTARFLVGSDPDDAAVRVHEKVRANYDSIPVGVSEPQIVTRGINDVPAVVLTLTPRADAAGRWSDQALYDVAARLRTEIGKVEDVGLTFIVGGRPSEIRVEPDPARMAARGVALSSVLETVAQANRSFPAGAFRDQGQAVALRSGARLSTPDDASLLTVRSMSGEPVYLRDVATVVQAPREDQARTAHYARVGEGWSRTPAVSLAVAKRQGANAVVVSHGVMQRVEALKGTLIPDGLEVVVTRDYGETANEKANELLMHLGLATLSIVILIGFAVGWREAGVTAVVIPTTILLTLFASNLMGYTINRVSLFALIFSIGILVDDAIVMIENIARHWAMNDGRTRAQATVEAVAEVGNPTVVATLTVVAALLPMLFVSGLMGPYMAPIPVNASAAMIFSFFVAVVIAPWLMIRLARKTLAVGHGHEHGPGHGEGMLGRLYRRVATPVIRSRRSAWTFLIVVGVATLLAMAMFGVRAVPVKLLPFDNKSELQVVLDMPEGTSLEATERTLAGAAAVAGTLPEVESLESYAGTAAPFNFNGLVRHYFLRAGAEQGDLAVMLAPKGERDRSSHAIALDLRRRLADLPLLAGASIKVVEAPPGPPVLATLLAEVYGPDAATRRAVAAELETLFRAESSVVDVDNSYGVRRPVLRLIPDREKIERFGLSEREVHDSIAAVMGGQILGYTARDGERTPMEIAVRLPQSARTWNEQMAVMPVAVTTLDGGRRLVELGEVVEARRELASWPVYRRDGRAAEMVTAELAGQFFTYVKESRTPPGVRYEDQRVAALAKDIQAAVAMLRARPDVDPDRVGVVGISQAGWSAPLAAIDGGGVAFMTLISAPPISSWEQELDSQIHNLSSLNLTEAQRAEARRAMELMFASARAGAVSQELTDAVARLKTEPWFSRALVTDRPEDLAALNEGFFDPKPILEQLNIPVLLAFGGADMITPYAPYIPQWRNRLAVAGGTDLTIKVYPGYGHGLVNQAGANRFLAPLFLETMTDWLRTRAGLVPMKADVSDADALSQADAMLQVEDLVGSYIADGKVITVTSMPGGLLLNDLDTGRVGLLHPDPDSSTRFRLVSNRGMPTAEVLSFSKRDGRPALILNEPGEDRRIALRSDAVEEEISYRTGDGLEQHGIFVKPAGPGPYPVVVFQGGAGPATRQTLVNWAHMFAANGVAALSIDKRGYGASAGDGPGATLALNAADASAAVDYLAARPDVRADRIGMIGTSRGGWTAPMAAAINDKIAFLVVSAGGPIGAGEQERYARLRRLETAGVDQQTLAVADDVLEKYFAYLASDRRDNAAAVSDNWRRYGEQRWYRSILPSADPTTGELSPALRVFGDDLRLDAVGLYERLNLPILFMGGADDEAVPTATVMARVRRMAESRPQWSMRIFPAADHNFRIAATDRGVQKTVPGYYDAMLDWIGDQGRTLAIKETGR